MTLIERLRALGQRRVMEGIYLDQNICEAAIEEIERLRGENQSWKALVQQYERERSAS